MGTVRLRAGLDVSFNLVALAALLFSIVAPGCPIELDSLNSPTPGPIPGGLPDMGTRPR